MHLRPRRMAIWGEEEVVKAVMAEQESTCLLHAAYDPSFVLAKAPGCQRVWLEKARDPPNPDALWRITHLGHLVHHTTSLYLTASLKPAASDHLVVWKGFWSTSTPLELTEKGGRQIWCQEEATEGVIIRQSQGRSLLPEPSRGVDGSCRSNGWLVRSQSGEALPCTLPKRIDHLKSKRDNLVGILSQVNPEHCRVVEGWELCSTKLIPGFDRKSDHWIYVYKTPLQPPKCAPADSETPLAITLPIPKPASFNDDSFGSINAIPWARSFESVAPPGSDCVSSAQPGGRPPTMLPSLCGSNMERSSPPHSGFNEAAFDDWIPSDLGS